MHAHVRMCLCVQARVCMCMHVLHVCRHVYVCMHAHVLMCHVCAGVCMCMHMCRHVHMCMCAHMCLCAACVQACVYVYVCTCVQCAVCVQACVHVYACAACVQACVCVYMCAHVLTCCMCAGVCVHVYACVHLCLCATYVQAGVCGCVCIPTCANMDHRHVQPSHNMAASRKRGWAGIRSGVGAVNVSLSWSPRQGSQLLFFISAANMANVNVCSFWVLRTWVFGYSLYIFVCFFQPNLKCEDQARRVSQ